MWPACWRACGFETDLFSPCGVEGSFATRTRLADRERLQSLSRRQFLLNLSDMVKYAVVDIPGGSAGFVVTDKGVSKVVLAARGPSHTRKRLAIRFPDGEYEAGLLPEFQKQLREYFAGRLRRFRVKVDLSSLTAFQRQVLDRCVRIGYGRTKTYGQLAREVGRPNAARAVGGAMARNPVPLVIPCHRVVAGDGSLGGFSAEQGVSLKQRLLEMERARAAFRPEQPEKVRTASQKWKGLQSRS